MLVASFPSLPKSDINYYELVSFTAPTVVYKIRKNMNLFLKQHSRWSMKSQRMWLAKRSNHSIQLVFTMREQAVVRMSGQEPNVSLIFMNPERKRSSGWLPYLHKLFYCSLMGKDETEKKWSSHRRGKQTWSFTSSFSWQMTDKLFFFRAKGSGCLFFFQVKGNSSSIQCYLWNLSKE